MEENCILQFVLSFHLDTLCHVLFRVGVNSAIPHKKKNDNDNSRSLPLFVLNSSYVDIVYLFSGDDHNLCWKDLSEEVISELDIRLKGDQTAFKQICQSFGMDSSQFYSRNSVFIEILGMFPDTPVKLLKKVFEALQLYDLIDLLEEGKPRATRSL